MAFGDALRPTDGATVILNVDTSQTAKLERAEAEWRESVGQMSREALKLDLAQERLKKSLQQYGAESVQAKRATIALRDAEEQAARAADRHSREIRDVDRAHRGAALSAQSLRRSVLGLAAAYVGIHGLTAGIRSVVEAAREEELVHGQTRVALQSLGIAYDQHIGRIEKVIRAQSKLGFDDEELLKTFQMFVRSTKDVNKALELNALAIDVARGRYIDLEQAAQIVNKANLGMSGALRRIGLDVERNADRTKLLASLQRAYGRAAEDAATTSVAAAERLGVEWENLQEIIGQGLLPAVTQLATRLADYFGDAENQRRLQEQVNRAVETGEQVVRGFVGALRLVREALSPVVSALGGAENAAKAFFLVFSAAKVAGVIRSLVGLRVAIAALGATSTRSAAISVASMNAIGTAATVNAGKVAALRAALAALVPSAAAVTAATIAAVVTTPGASGAKEGDRRSMRKRLLDGAYADKYPRTTAVAQKAVREGLSSLSPRERSAFQIAWNATKESDLARAEAVLANEGSHVAPDSVDPRRPGAQPPKKPTPPNKPTGQEMSESTSGAGRTIEDILLDQARAAATRSSADDLRFHREAAAYYKRRIDALERRKNLTAKQKEELRRLYGQLAAEQAAIDAIEAEGEAKIAAQREEAERKREAARERADRRMERIREQAARRAEERAELFAKAKTGRHGWNRQGMRAAALAGVNETVEGLRKKGMAAAGGLSEADVRRMQVEFLQGLQGITNQFAGNLGTQVDTNTWQMVQLTRQQNRTLERLASGVSHPGARYARTEMAAAFGGVGAL